MLKKSTSTGCVTFPMATITGLASALRTDQSKLNNLPYLTLSLMHLTVIIWVVDVHSNFLRL